LKNNRETKVYNGGYPEIIKPLLMSIRPRAVKRKAIKKLCAKSKHPQPSAIKRKPSEVSRDFFMDHYE